MEKSQKIACIILGSLIAVVISLSIIIGIRIYFDKGVQQVIEYKPRFEELIKQEYGSEAHFYKEAVVRATSHSTGDIFHSGETILENGLETSIIVEDKCYSAGYNITNDYIMTDYSFMTVIDDIIDTLPIDKSLVIYTDKSTYKGFSDDELADMLENPTYYWDIKGYTSNDKEPYTDNNSKTDNRLYMTSTNVKTFEDLLKEQSSGFTISTDEDISTYKVEQFEQLRKYADHTKYNECIINISGPLIDNKCTYIKIKLNCNNEDNDLVVNIQTEDYNN